MKIKTINSHCVAVYHKRPSDGLYRVTVYSYDTPVLTGTEECEFIRHWSGWSLTTQRDINKAIPDAHMTKATWDKMPVVPADF